jgi:hypothetical protein
MERDPIGLAGGQANLYQFVGSEPVDQSDPMGLQGPGMSEAYASAYRASQEEASMTYTKAMKILTNLQTQWELDGDIAALELVRYFLRNDVNKPKSFTFSPAAQAQIRKQTHAMAIRVIDASEQTLTSTSCPDVYPPMSIRMYRYSANQHVRYTERSVMGKGEGMLQATRNNDLQEENTSMFRAFGGAQFLVNGSAKITKRGSYLRYKYEANVTISDSYTFAPTDMKIPFIAPSGLRLTSSQYAALHYLQVEGYRKPFQYNYSYSFTADGSMTKGIDNGIKSVEYSN